MVAAHLGVAEVPAATSLVAAVVGHNCVPRRPAVFAGPRTFGKGILPELQGAWSITAKFNTF